MATTKERFEFLMTLRDALPNLSRDQVYDAGKLLLRHALSHGNIQEAICNGPGDYVNRIPYPEAGKIYEEHQTRCEKREQQLERRMKEIADKLGIEIRFGGDPRGYTVRLMLPDGRYNTWGGAEYGYGVPQ